MVKSYEDTIFSTLGLEEEKKILQKLRKGDLVAKNILIEKNLYLVVNIAKKFVSERFNLETLVNIGTIGLIKAINNYDFQTVFKEHMMNSIKKEIAGYINNSKAISS